MINQPLIDGITKHLRKGDSPENIKKRVLQAGYSLDEFQLAFKEAAQQQKTQEPQVVNGSASVTNTKPAGKTSLRNFLIVKWFYILGGFFITALLGGFFFVYLFMNETLDFTSLLSEPPFPKEEVATKWHEKVSAIKSARYIAKISVVSEPRDDDAYPLPPSPSEKQSSSRDDVFTVSDLVEMIPSDFKLSLGTAGEFGVRSSSTSLWNKFSGSIDLGDLLVTADVELISTAIGKWYLRINRMPSAFFFDISSVKKQWIEIEDEKLAELFEEFDNIEPSEEMDRSLLLWSLIEKNDFLTSVDEPERELVDGNVAYKYRLSLKQEMAETFFTELRTMMMRQYPNWFLTRALFDADIAYLSDPNTIAYLNDNIPIYVWFTPDGLPKKISIQPRVVVDEEKYPNLKNRQVSIEFSTMFEKVNQDISIKIPTESITLAKAAEKVPFFDLFTDNQTEFQDLRQMRVIKQFQVTAELYKDEFGLYPTTIESYLSSDYSYSEIDTETILYASDDGSRVYIICAQLAQENHYCATSSGESGTVNLNKLSDSLGHAGVSVGDMRWAVVEGLRSGDLLTAEERDEKRISAINSIELEFSFYTKSGSTRAKSYAAFWSDYTRETDIFTNERYLNAPDFVQISLREIKEGNAYAICTTLEVTGEEECAKGPYSALSLVPQTTKDDLMLGDPNKALFTLIVYMDYDCDRCDEYHRNLKRLFAERNLDYDVAIVYRHAPQENLIVAEALECIQDQTVQNDTTNAIFFLDSYFSLEKESRPTKIAGLRDIGENAGLIVDPAQFSDCMKDYVHTESVYSQTRHLEDIFVYDAPYLQMYSKRGLDFGNNQGFISYVELIGLIEAKLVRPGGENYQKSVNFWETFDASQ